MGFLGKRSNNTALRGGGINCTNSTLDLVRVTVKENAGIERGAGIMVNNSDIYMEGCMSIIVMYNTALTRGG